MNQKILLLFLVAGLITVSARATESTPPEFKSNHKFIVNEGQVSGWENAPSEIRYYLQRGLMTVYFLEDRVSYVLRNPNDKQLIESRIDLSFGSTTKSTIYGLAERSSNIKYFTTDCPEGVDAKEYEKVVYEDVYQNIDLVYYFDGKGTLKYDFIVHPGGDPADIQLTYEGDLDVEVDEEGKLLVQSEAGVLNEAAPFTYLECNKSVVSSSYQLNGNKLGFNISTYDPAETLVIDPEVEWSTFYGGESFDDGINSAVDAEGNVYLTGKTYSLTFPNISSAYGNGEKGDIVVGKFDSEGNHIWTIYYGGDAESEGRGIATDGEGNVYVVGKTNSQFLPDPQSDEMIEASGNSDIIILKIDENGGPTEVQAYGSFNGMDIAEGIEIYNEDEIYITGLTSTSEEEFPVTPGAHQMVKAEDLDAFLMKIDSELDITWATYYGGQGGDEAYGIGVDNDGNPYITGATSSNNLPTAGNTFTPGTSEEATDVFVAKFGRATGNLLWSQYYGGTEKDFAYDLVVYEDDFLYVVGETSSTDFEISNSDTLDTYQGSLNGKFDGFIIRMDAQTGLAQWSSYLGGSEDDRFRGVTITDGGEAIVTGYTESEDFPTVNTDDAVRENFQGGEEDAFLALFSDAGDLRYSGYFGGSNIDIGRDLIFNRANEKLHVIGRTRSGDFPTIGNSYQPQYNGGADIFIYTLSPQINPSNPVDTTQTEPTDTIPDLFCDAVLNNVISENPLFDGDLCIEDQMSSVLFYGTTPIIYDNDGNEEDEEPYNFVWQIAEVGGTFVNVRDEDGNMALGKNLLVSDIDLSNYPPGVYYVRRLVIAEACTDASSIEVLDYEDLTYSFADFDVVGNCGGQDIQLLNTSNISGNALTNINYTVTVDGNSVNYAEENPVIGSFPGGTIEITLEIESDEGCVDTETRVVEIDEAPVAGFEYANDVVCLDYPYQFTSISTSDDDDPIVSYLYDFGNGDTSTEESPLYEFTEPGAKTVTLTIETENGCTDQFTMSFDANEVFEAPTVDAGADREIEEGVIIQLEPTVTFPGDQTFAAASWTSNPDGAFDHEGIDPNMLFARARPLEDSYLTLVVTSNLGCSAEDSLLVEVTPDDGGGDGDDITVPNLFTPNGDGFNDEFDIPGLGPFPEAVVRIFNRWGSMVYSATDYANNPWDGTYDGEPAPSGIYYYIITFPDGRELEGTVTLFR